MALRPIEYEADGHRMRGLLAEPAGDGPWPGVLVAHEAPGLNDNIKSRTIRLAELGYMAFALDMHGEEGFELELAMSRHAELMSTPGLLLRRAQAALQVLSSQAGADTARLAGIGFCQGGITVLELARSGAPLKAAVGFHPGLTRPAGSPDGPISAKVLMMVGDQDPVAPQPARDAFAREMDAKGADWQLHLFGGVGHTYTNPAVNALKLPGYRYDAAADRRSWAMMLDLLQEVFTAE